MSSDDRTKSSRDFIAEMVNKSHHAGRIYRLPSLSQLAGKVMQKGKLKAWQSAFMALFKEDEQINVKHTMFLWRYDDDLDAEAVRNGIPGSANDVKWLFTNGRLHKSDFSPELTTDEMNIINLAEELKFPDATGTPTACSKCSKTHTGTCQNKLDVYDKVAMKITGNQFKTAQKLFEGGENFPEKTQQNLTRLRKVVENFKSQMSNYINLDMLSQFEDGHYHSWTVLIQAIYRIYKIDDAQENMSQLFHNIDTVVQSDSNSTETKIGKLRDILRKVQIRGQENYFMSKDHEHGREWQMVDEHYSPQVNTLLTYIICKEKVEKKKWDDLQLAFERKIESGWSYQKWHESRPELYKLMDEAQKTAKPQSGGAVCGITDSDTPPQVDDVDQEYADKVEQLQLEINQMRRGNWRNSNRNGSWNNQGFRKEANSQQRGNFKSSDKPGKTRSQLCVNCTHYSGTAVYHKRSFGGDGDQCIYDKSGNKKNSPAFGNQVAMLESQNDDGGNSDQNSLKAYYEERLAALADITNQE